MEKSLSNALRNLKKDQVVITINNPIIPEPDQEITIDTKHYTLVLGANDLGVWLEKFAEK